MAESRPGLPDDRPSFSNVPAPPISPCVSGTGNHPLAEPFGDGIRVVYAQVPFRSSPTFRLRYGITALLELPVVAVTYGPLALVTNVPFVVSVVIAALAVVALAIFLAWTVLRYASMEYELRDDELSWRRGVWFRQTGIVPYVRITNTDVRRGR